MRIPKIKKGPQYKLRLTGENKVMENLHNKYDLTEILGVSISTIDNKMKDGSLSYYKFGKSVRFSEEQIKDFMRKNNREQYTSSMITDQQVERLRKSI